MCVSYTMFCVYLKEAVYVQVLCLLEIYYLLSFLPFAEDWWNADMEILFFYAGLYQIMFSNKKIN